MIWALIISHALILALGIGIGRKHSKELTALRDEAEEWKAKFKALKG